MMITEHRAHQAEDSVDIVVRFAQPRLQSFQMGVFVCPTQPCRLYTGFNRYVPEPGNLPSSLHHWQRVF